MKSNFLKLIFTFCFLFLPIFTFADTVISTGNVLITATVGFVEEEEEQNLSSNPSGYMPIGVETIVNFSGFSYPNSKIFILKDGQIIKNIYADSLGIFNYTIKDLNESIYKFSVYAEDLYGQKSHTYTFPILVNTGATINISNIYISPTVNLDKSEVKKGDFIKIFGQAISDSKVKIFLNSNTEYFFEVLSDSEGKYFYNLNTLNFDFGKYFTKSKSFLSNIESPFSSIISFIIGDRNKLMDELLQCSLIKADLNCDGRVNLIDFSILAYWYKKNNPPSKIDLNYDGKINLVDFSIMAFNWTG